MYIDNTNKLSILVSLTMLDGQLGMLYPSFYLKAHIIVIMYYHNTCTGS